MFGTSGIRGLYGKEVTEELALKIGNLFSDKDVIIARDIRNTGESLQNAIISGVLSSGKNAITLGIVPTPTLALATKKFSCNGIMITASHNPSEYNGLKLFSNGLEISRAKEKELTEKYNKGKLNYAKWDSLGKLSSYKGGIQDHISLIKKVIDVESIKSKRPKVIVDCNGPGIKITPSLLKELGCEVIAINNSTEKFTRESEPNQKNLQELSKKVKEENADLGIAHDGDADRAIIVGEDGQFFSLDVQLCMMIQHELDLHKEIKNKKIITTVESSLIVRETIEKNNAQSLVTPVGSLYIAELLEKENALFGGEPCGEYLFKDGVICPDGVLTAAKFVELFSQKGSLNSLAKEYTTYPILREKFKCENSKKYGKVEEIKSKIQSQYKKVNTEDGIRVDEEHGWFLIRASGTEPIIRLTMEYKSKDKLEKMSKSVSSLILSMVN